MKLIVALAVLSSVSGFAEPAFVGLMSDREHGVRYAIMPSTGGTARWVQLGDTVEGYSVAEYQAANDVLVLKKADRTLALKLKIPRVESVSPSKSDTAKAKALSDAQKKLSDAQERLKRLREEREKMLAGRRAKEKSSTSSGKE